MSGLRSMMRSEGGFSLAELLVVMAVLGLMLAGLLAVQMQGQDSYLMGASRVEAQQNGRVALELMVRELRSAQSVTAIASATDMTFVDENGVTIQYQLSGTTLNRVSAGTSTPLIGGVTSLTLTYFSAFNGATNTGTTTAVATSVRAVRIQLVTTTENSVASYSMASQSAVLESFVQLRNI